MPADDPIAYLSDEWVAALAAAAADYRLPADVGDAEVTIQQVVCSADGDRRYAVQIVGGRVVVLDGEVADADVRFTADRRVAAQIASGERSAQEAFMVGELVVGGDLDALVSALPALAALDDVFGAVRARTRFER